MAKPSYNLRHQEALDTLLLSLPGVTSGKMFGYPAYFVAKKLFACVYENGVGVKVPEELSTRLLHRADVIPFQPLGKHKMREWIQINHENSADYHLDMEIFRASIEFVGKASQPKGKTL